MSEEYRVTFTNISPLREEKERYEGVLIRIRPPVQLDSDAVNRYLSWGEFEPVWNKNYENTEIRDIAVLGNTAVQTTIYASTHRGHAKEVAKRTVEFLQLMGAQAVLDQVQTPDTNS